MFSSDSLLLIGAPTGWEWIIIVVAVLVLFGGKKIPEFMRGIGKGIREFNDAKENVKKEIETGMTEKDKDEEIRRLKQQLEEKNAAQ
ncbi:MAG: twin-arginine translocase TatA/TatE family subunit [Sphingobacteriales bacterium]|nr:MAG: twin-arginine translocase TatA/TatE family subunit [Sphingobacteriales bacterium]